MAPAFTTFSTKYMRQKAILIRITDMAQLYPHVGANGDLTPSGLDYLAEGNARLKDAGEGSAEAAMKKEFLAVAESHIAPSNAMGVKLPRANE